MSRRGFLARISGLLFVSSLVGGILLLLSVFFLLDLGPESRRQESIKTAIYACLLLVALHGIVFWQLLPVLRLLGAWERGRSPDETILRRAQNVALTVPNRLIVQLSSIVLVASAVSVYVDAAISGYQLVPVLINAALTATFFLGIALVINIGLRVILRPVLIRIPLPPQVQGGRFSVAMRISLITVLINLILLVAAGAFAYSYVVKVVDERTAQELSDRLQEVVIPAMQKAAFWQFDLTQYARSGEELFLVNRAGRYVQRVPEHTLTAYERRLLAQTQGTFVYKRDYSDFRLVAIPVEDQFVLCLVYQSQAAQSKTVQTGMRAFGVLFVLALGFAFSIGLVASLDIAYAIRYVTGRLTVLVGQKQTTQQQPVAQTSLDEVGDLVQAFNHVQERAAAYEIRLQDSVAALERTDERRQHLLDTMVGLTAPVIPVAEGLVVVFLSGYFDEERAAHIRPHLLKGIASARAQIAIVDLTAVVEVSEPLARQLYRAIRSVMLMGCQVVLTGANPDAAWALTQVESATSDRRQLGDLPTRRSLEDGLAYAYDRLHAN